MMTTGKGLVMLPLFVRDYVTATRHLTLAERGAYTDLLFFQWELGRLPREPERLARLIGCSAEEFGAVWPAIKAKFVQIEVGLINTRLEEHRAEVLRLRDVRAEVGRIGGKQSASKRASKTQAKLKQTGKQNSSSVASNLLDGLLVAKSNHPNPNPNPNKSIRKKTAAAPPLDESWFENFKAIYPKRAGDQGWPAAAQAVQVRLRQGYTPEEMIEGAQRYALYVRATQSEGSQFVKMAASFIGRGTFFLDPWPLPASKADNRLESNISAAEEFMRLTEPK
jgi:uncharacterized protein YdaU (DUF1376 family)